ncbi:MAG: hypothetical protein WBN22_01865 [Verrucomicrobiia bacterium]
MKLEAGSWKLGTAMAQEKRLPSCPSSLRFDATAPQPKAKAGSAVALHRFQNADMSAHSKAKAE